MRQRNSNNYFHQLHYKLILSLILIFLGFQSANAQEICLTAADGDQIRETTPNGYTYELWNQDNEGLACITPSVNGTTFSARWDNTFNFLARRGLGFDGSRLTHAQRGDFQVKYNANYNPGCQSGTSYLSVYGWTRDFAKEEASSPGSEQHKEALVEYYIIESWCNWNPSQASDAVSMGSFTADGSTYDLYRMERIGQPSIRANSDDFVQYFSIRRNERTSGTINVTAHFERWESATGIPMGGLHEVMMKVEGYDNNRSADGSISFSELEVKVLWPHSQPPVTFDRNTYNITQWCGNTFPTGPGFNFHSDFGGGFPDIRITSSNNSVVETVGQSSFQYLIGRSPGTATISMYAGDWEHGNPDDLWDTATVQVAAQACPPDSGSFRIYELRAHGTQGDEVIEVTVDGSTVATHELSTEFETYKGIVSNEGDVAVEFVNDDGVANGRDVRLDYIEVNGERRETEDQTQNNAAYANGVCGGGAYTEWLHCAGGVNYGIFESAETHTVTLRARGNAGGEHINLLIDGEVVGNWTLSRSYQEFAVTVEGDGDINVEFDNDGGSRDAIIDWVKVDNQTPRQAEHMDFNTGAWGNGQCGGGTRTQWLHCNGRIGFGKISDNFN